MTVVAGDVILHDFEDGETRNYTFFLWRGMIFALYRYTSIEMDRVILDGFRPKFCQQG